MSPPADLGEAGLDLWRRITDAYDLSDAESALLGEACRTLDSCQALEAVVRAEGVKNESPQGVRAHPCLVELRQQRSTLIRLLKALAIPEDEADRPLWRERRWSPDGEAKATTDGETVR